MSEDDAVFGLIAFMFILSIIITVLYVIYSVINHIIDSVARFFIPI